MVLPPCIRREYSQGAPLSAPQPFRFEPDFVGGSEEAAPASFGYRSARESCVAGLGVLHVPSVSPNAEGWMASELRSFPSLRG
jgi:hypothetical protein